MPSLFAPDGLNLPKTTADGAMSDDETARVLAEAVRRGNPTQSPAYHYLKRQYPRLKKLGYDTGPGLGSATIRDLLTAAGYSNGQGKPFTAKIAGQLFRRVRRDVLAERAARASRPPLAERPPGRPRVAAPPFAVPPATPPRPAPSPAPAPVSAAVAHARGHLTVCSKLHASELSHLACLSPRL